MQRARRFATTRTAEGRIEWLENHCGQRARVGVMNAGKLAYLAGFRSRLVIINLDGVVNNALLEAYRRRTFVQYYCENVDCALELPAPSVFRDPELRAAFDQFRRTMVEQVSRQPLTLYRVRHRGSFCWIENEPGPRCRGPGSGIGLSSARRQR